MASREVVGVVEKMVKRCEGMERATHQPCNDGEWKMKWWYQSRIKWSSGDQVVSLKILLESHPPGPERGPDFSSALQAEPSVTGSDLGLDCLGGIQVDFQAGELVSPATKLYIHF